MRRPAKRMFMGIVERVVLGSMMSVALVVIEWQMVRTQKRKRPSEEKPG